MYFLGLLWAVSAIGSFWAPQDTPRLLDYLSRAVRGRTSFLANQVITRPSHSSSFSNHATTQRGAKTATKSSSLSASRLWSPALSAFIETRSPVTPSVTPFATRGITDLVVQPVTPGTSSPGLSLNFSYREGAMSITHLMGGLFRRSSEIRDVFKLTAPLITVNPVKNPCYALESEWQTWNNWRYKSNHGTRTLELGECTGLWRSDVTLPIPTDIVFQIRVKGQIIAEVPTQTEAEQLARQLHENLRHPEFTPHSLSLSIVAGMPVGKARDRVLFGIKPEWAELLDRNSELMAIDWINNLRVALDAPALSVVEAQSQMHGLVTTGQRIQGSASWYGPYFHGRLTATGEVFDQHQLTAAHPSLPFNTYLKVKNQSNDRTIIVRINDRGPYFEDRSLDLSQEAARSLGSEMQGIVSYEAVVMEKAELAQVKESELWVASQAVRPQRSWVKQQFKGEL